MPYSEPSGFIDISFENRSATIANIYAADKAMQRATLRLVQVYGPKTRDHAKRICPVSPKRGSYLGGRLRSSIEVRFTEKGYHYEVFCNREVFDRDGVAYYPWFVELGTSRMEAQPFLEPAHNENFPLFRKDLGVEIRKSLRRREQRIRQELTV